MEVLVRNRKANVGGFTRRIAQRKPIELGPAELEAHEAVSEYLRYGYQAAVQSKNLTLGFLMVTYHKMLASSSQAIRESLKRRLAKLQDQLRASTFDTARLKPAREDELRDADTLSDALDEFEAVVGSVELELEIEQLSSLIAMLGKIRDSKALELLKLITATQEREPDAKILIFTQFVETQLFLQKALNANGFDVEVFNGRMSLDEKERAVESFRENAQVLVSTESGGEGRNFQFAHILVNYDLPWNPMKVEQRIGRLDRIGQQRDVIIYNLVSEGTVEDRVLELLTQRIQLFEASVGSLDPILGQVERDIEQIVMTAHDLSASLREYGEKNLDQRLAEAKAKEHALADFILDEASLRRDEAKRLIEGIDPMARAEDLERLVGEVLDHYGGTLARTEDEEAALTLSPALANKIRSTERVSIGVFDPKQALRLEHRPFFAFGNRLVDALVELPIQDHPVTASVQQRTGADEPYVELIYELVTEGMINRGALIRHTVTADLRVAPERLTKAPEVGTQAEDTEMPPWVMKAIEVSRTAIDEELHRRRNDVDKEDAAVRADRLKREKRVHDEMVQRLNRRILELENRIADMRQRGGQQQRIIPALQGQIHRTRELIAEHDAKHEDEIQTIAQQQSSSMFRMLSASLVVPR